MRKIAVSGGGTVVLFSWSTVDEHKFANLLRLTDDGEVRWQAELPPHPKSDVFTSVSVEGGVVSARSFRCGALGYDLETGERVGLAA